MSLENGSNLFNYSYSILEKYVKDNLIFTKALQIIQLYENRKSFPYSFDELEKSLSPYVGLDFKFFSFYLSKYIINQEESIPYNPLTIDGNFVEPVEIHWNPKGVFTYFVEDIPEKEEGIVYEEFTDITKIYDEKIIINFIDDITSFSYAVNSTLENIWARENNPMGVRRVDSFGKTYENAFPKNIRITRNDEKYLDIYCNKEDIEFLISILNKFLEEN